jgi:hypothetical protein
VWKLLTGVVLALPRVLGMEKAKPTFSSCFLSLSLSLALSLPVSVQSEGDTTTRTTSSVKFATAAAFRFDPPHAQQRQRSLFRPT